MSADDDRFCPECDVSLDLHNGEDDCNNAIAKANLIARFWLFPVGGDR